MYEVVVVGGNLSGTFAAINAVNPKVNVALVERHKEPFIPAHCGEAIADVTADFLNLDKIGCPKNEITKIVVNIASPKQYHFKLTGNKIYIIDRTYLERELLKIAENKGVKLFLGVRMLKFNPPNEIILSNNKKITGKVIIDASGIKCIVSKYIGLDTKLKPQEIGVCIQSRVKSNFDAHTIYLWFNDPYAPLGYAWLFPINEKEANIGLGVRGGQNLDLKKSLDEYITFMTNGSYKITSTFRACEPMAQPLNSLVKNNVMFVGDAARVVDPASGAGIHNAAFSGSLAGSIAAKYVQKEITSLKVYEEAMKNKTNRIQKTYNKISQLNTVIKYTKEFKKTFLILNVFNKLIPNFFQGQVVKTLKKDKKILKRTIIQ